MNVMLEKTDTILMNLNISVHHCLTQILYGLFGRARCNISHMTRPSLDIPGVGHRSSIAAVLEDELMNRIMFGKTTQLVDLGLKILDSCKMYQ